MTHPTCTIDGCERAHQARGLCSSHYGTWHRATHGRKPLTYARVCDACGEGFEATTKQGRFCSTLCFTFTRNGPRVCKWSAPKPKRLVPPPFRTTRSCLWCDDEFTTTYRSQVYCSAEHKTRAKRNRRRGREYGWTSNFTWAEVMKVWRKFDRLCAYCDGEIEGLPDPDHVVPLSRGGSNSITNILPCCSPCNSDKRDLLLSEWNADRERRGLPLRTTSWAIGDPRVTHLMLLATAAA